MALSLSLEELAARTGETVARLREWHDRGLVPSRGDGRFGPRQIALVRLIQYLLGHGADLERIATGFRGGLASTVEMVLDAVEPAGHETAWTLEDAAREVGLELDQARRLVEAAGVFDADDLLGDEDVAMLRVAAEVLAGDFPEEALVQLLRVLGDALGRVAEAEWRLFHFYVHERLAARGLAGNSLFDASNVRTRAIAHLAEPAILFFHRKGMGRAGREDLLLHVLPEGVARGAPPGELPTAVAFFDLSGFTPLAEAMGDVHATGILARFAEIVREAARRWGGRLVKQIGDAFMLVFFAPRPALACALEVEERVAEEPAFPAVRAGIHWGGVLYREGDYFGAGVNLAARLAAAADRHQILVSGAVRDEVGTLAGVEIEPLGARTLKGIAEPVDLFAVRRAGGLRPERRRDLVCGMELGDADIAARLVLEGEERVFCSERCLRRFVEAPAQYLGR